MFILYCFDRKFYQYGYPVSDNVSHDLKIILIGFAPYMSGDYNPNLLASVNNPSNDDDMKVESYVRDPYFSQ